MMGPVSKEYSNTTEARVSIQKERTAGIRGFMSMNDWLDDAKLNDEWPFLVRESKPPIDLFKSLGLGDELSDTDEVVWLTLEGYLDLRKKAALVQYTNDEAALMEAGIREPS
jgi:hypothetical protein